MSVLRVRDLSAGYGGTSVVRHVDFDVDAGEVVALLGPNGAGKTTTLLAISGLVEILGGDAEVLGRSVKGRAPHRIARDGLAHVPEDRGLFPRLTVGEHLALRRGSRRAALGDAFAYFPALEPLVDRRAALLSGGEQQMLALAQALIAKPRLLVLDELSLGLAPLLVERLLPVIRRFADTTGAGVVLVEQHVHLALEVADRAVVLSRGSVVLTSDAAPLRTDPKLLTDRYLATSSGET